MKLYRFNITLPAMLLAAGCFGPVPVPIPKPADNPPVALAGTKFEPGNVGLISGEVVWKGPRPQRTGFAFSRMTPGQRMEMRQFANPNDPIISDEGKVVEAVLFLRGIDPAKGKPWNILQPRIAMRDFEIHMADSPSNRIGIAPVGSELEMRLEQDEFQALRARGSAFFTLMFPERDSVLRRPFDKEGIVEFSSGAGCYWTHAYLFVSNHPYAVLSDSQGRFDLNDIPPGDYELTCWLPNWNVERTECDPELGSVTRQFYMPPLEKSVKVRIEKGKTETVRFEISSVEFSRKMN